MKVCIIMAALLGSAVLQAGYRLDVDLDRPEGFYRTGDTVKFSFKLTPDQKGRLGEKEKIRFVLKFEHKIMQRKIVEATTEPVIVEFTGPRPGWCYFGLEVLNEEGKARRDMPKHRMKPTIVNEIGALFDAEKITPVILKPDDYDAFWANRRAELDKVPIEAKLEPVEVPAEFRDKIECFAVTVGCLGRTPVTGYLALPKNAKKKSLPAMVDYLSLSWVSANPEQAISNAARGAVAFYATWHGLPVGHAPKFYEDDPVLGRGPYGKRMADDRETWFFGDMFLRVMRAMDYVKTRPEWDGKTLIIQGGSLGGSQAIAAAALDPDVTLAVVGVPSLCEFTAFQSGRRPGLPYRTAKLDKMIETDPATQHASAYFDSVNFASRIKCEIFVSTGLTDETCYPSNVFAFYNSLPAGTKKAIYVNPRTGHFGTTPNVKGNARLAELFETITVY